MVTDANLAHVPRATGCSSGPTEATVSPHAEQSTTQRSGLRAARILASIGLAVVVARYLTDGSPDLEFGSGGFSVIDIGRSDGARGVLVQSDGKILLAGPSGNAGLYQLALTRHLGS
jgi:Domain of unknown function (DUF5122) beta-propeller